MKKGNTIKRISGLVLLFVLALGLTGCIKFVSITDKIEVVANTVREEVTVEDLDIKDIIIKVIKANGDSIMYPLSLDMISSADEEKLSKVGTHVITVNYDKKTTKFTLNIVAAYSKVKVSYEVNGGLSQQPTQEDRYKALETLPTPTKNGYNFKGWYLESYYKTPAEGYIVSSDITLYAFWQPKTNVVTFNHGYELPEYAENLKTQSVLTGDVVHEYQTLKRLGYTFAGWYTDQNFTTKYDFTKPVANSFTIYGLWNPTN